MPRGKSTVSTVSTECVEKKTKEKKSTRKTKKTPEKELVEEVHFSEEEQEPTHDSDELVDELQDDSDDQQGDDDQHDDVDQNDDSLQEQDDPEQDNADDPKEQDDVQVKKTVTKSRVKIVSDTAPEADHPKNRKDNSRAEVTVLNFDYKELRGELENKKVSECSVGDLLKWTITETYTNGEHARRKALMDVLRFIAGETSQPQRPKRQFRPGTGTKGVRGGRGKPTGRNFDQRQQGYGRNAYPPMGSMNPQQMVPLQDPPARDQFGRVSYKIQPNPHTETWRSQERHGSVRKP